MKEKFKSYSFWMSVTAAVILVINNIGKVLGFEVDGKVVTQIVDSICGVLILFGVITMAKTKKTDEDVESNTDELKSDDNFDTCEKESLNSKLNQECVNTSDAFKNIEDDESNKH